MEKEFLIESIKAIKNDYGHRCSGVSVEKMREYKEVVRYLSSIIFDLYEKNKAFSMENEMLASKIFELESRYSEVVEKTYIKNSLSIK